MPINEIICAFWKWIGLSPIDYSVCSEKRDLEEYMFPMWEELVSAAEDIVDKQQYDRSSINSVLTVLAFDNEAEFVLDYIVDNGSDAFTCELVTLGSEFYLSHARWQCAEIIRRRSLKSHIHILEKLTRDPNEYVAKRARNALNSMC